MSELEIWKDIPGFEGKYEASNFGRVRSLLMINRHGTRTRKTPLVIKQASGYNNYKKVSLSLNGKSKMFGVHKSTITQIFQKKTWKPFTDKEFPGIKTGSKSKALADYEKFLKEMGNGN